MWPALAFVLTRRFGFVADSFAKLLGGANWITPDNRAHRQAARYSRPLFRFALSVVLSLVSGLRGEQVFSYVLDGRDVDG